MTPVEAAAIPRSAEGTDQLRAVAQATTALIAYFDAEGRFVWANPAVLERLGQPMEQIRGRRFQDVSPLAQYALVADKFQLSLKGHALCFEIMEAVEGRETWWQISYAPERGSDGRVRGMVSVAIDTTAQRAAQAALRESDRLARLAVEAADLGTWDWDVSSDVCRWRLPALAWAEAGPMSGERARLSDLLAAMHPEDSNHVKERIARALAVGGVLEGEFRVRLAGGAYAWLEATGHVFFDTSGRASRILGVVRDVTASRRDREERERLLEALEWEHERLSASERRHRLLFQELKRHQKERETIFDRVPAMIWYKDAENRIMRCNRAAADSRGMTVEQMEGRSTYELFPEEAAKYHADDLEVITSGKPKLGIIERYDAGGEKRWVQTDKIPHFDAAGKCVGVVVFTVDITERVRAEEILRESERAQREFVANVSHEFRTPVAAIKGFAETLRRGGLEDRRNGQRFVRIIERHAQRLGALIESLLTLSTLDSGMIKLDPTDVDLDTFVREYVESIGSLLRRRHIGRVEIRVTPGLRARADEPLLLQVLENLFGNATKFNKPGGSISVTARPRGRKEVLVTVRDTGHGISARDLPRIFDRFFKGQRASGAAASFGSTGLGLHLVKKIVESHGGRVWAESRPRRGSAFHFTLPRAKQLPPRAS